MKKYLTILLFALLTPVNGCAYNAGTNDVIPANSESIEVTKASSDSLSVVSTSVEVSSPYSNSVVCKLKLTASVSKEPYKNEFKASTNEEGKPLTITITDLEKDYPILITGDGSRVDLIKPKFAGNEKMVYLFELTGFGNLNVWTLFRDQNIITLTKQYSLAGAFSYAMIGDCQSGIL